MRILYLDLDTLRPDHLGCYGYHRNTSPTIDKIAGEGLRFTQYYCSDAPCLPSRAALMSGRFGIHTGVVNHGGSTADMYIEGRDRDFRDRLCAESLPGMLRGQGFKTVSISPFAERHSSWTFYAGFSEILNTGKGGMESAEDVTPTALSWIEHKASQDNWFLQLNYWDPHTPYRAPESFGNPFENDPLPDWLTPETLQCHRQMVGPHGAHEVAMYDNSTNPKFPRHPGEIADMQDLRRMIDGYDCGIRYMDGHIAQVLDAFAAQGVLDDMIIIVSADHGENLGELGLYGEHATADVATCRIPMIIRWPGLQQGERNGLHYNLDLLPTLCELLDGKASEHWDGRSFAADCRTESDTGWEQLIISQCTHVCQRSVRWDHWLYMRTYHDGYHLFPREMLFDMKADPHQTTNLAAQRRDICAQGAAQLLDWHDRMMATSDTDKDPLWTTIREGGPFHAKGHLPKYVEYLKATERGWAVEELTKRHPGEFE